ncbi:MAG: hypothetical protein JWO78_1495 [Micavibrio sp.]|nr:hypothetical protein [Micavibrio sp.]
MVGVYDHVDSQSGNQTPKALFEPEPPETELSPMPKSVWSKLYANRDGQMEMILDVVSEEGIKKVQADYRTRNPNSNFQKSEILKADGTYSSGTATKTLQSWGDVVQFAALRGVDLQGLTISPEQKKYAFKRELQNRKLTGVILDYASFDDMDLSGTLFTSSSMNYVSLQNTTGVRPNFESVAGQQMNFNGAKYVEPNFRKMTALRSNHFGSVYEQPVLRDTDWNSSHLVGAKIFLAPQRDLSFGLNLSGSLAAACLFYGMGVEKVQPYIRCNQAAFPGSAFHNVTMASGSSYMQKADFSALALNDPRLTEEEAAYAASFGQWLNSGESLDGLKVSPEMELPKLDTARIYTMISETEFSPHSANGETSIFSKQEVLGRTSFHECNMVDLNTLLPDTLRRARPALEPVPVVEEVQAVHEVIPVAKAGFIQVPELTFDRKVVEDQMTELASENASIGNVMSLGSKLQKSFNEASTRVSQWAMAVSGHQSSFYTGLKDLADRVEAHTLNAPLPVEIEDAPPPPPPVQKGFFAKLGAMFGAEQAEDRIMPVTPVTDAHEEKFAGIREDITGLQNRINESLSKNAERLENIGAMKKYLDTLRQAMTAYNEEIEKSFPALQETKDELFMQTLFIRSESLKESGLMLDTLGQSLKDLLEAEIKKGISIQWVQGVAMPKLNTQFSRAVGLHDLAIALKKGDGSYQQDQILSGLYNVCARNAGEGDKIEDQLEISFNASKTAIAEALRSSLVTMEKAETLKANALSAILTPV